MDRAPTTSFEVEVGASGVSRSQQTPLAPSTDHSPVPTAAMYPVARRIIGWTNTLLSIVVGSWILSKLYDTNWSGPMSPYTKHGILMVWGFLILTGNGLAIYRRRYGGVIDRVLDGKDGKSIRRALHALLQIAGSSCVVAAFGVILNAMQKLDNGDGEDKTTKSHIYIGYIAVFGYILQVIVGVIKGWKKMGANKDKKVFGFHGITGPILWAAGCCNVCLGLSFYWLGSFPGPTIAVIALICIHVVLTLVELFAAPAEESDAAKEYGKLHGPMSTNAPMLGSSAYGSGNNTAYA